VAGLSVAGTLCDNSFVPLHHRICNLCEACCGVIIETEGELVLSVRGDKDDPLSKGHICPKAHALKDLHEDPDRVVSPLVRRSGGWDEVSWDEAIEKAAQGIHRVQSEHGADAVATYLGNPTVHNLAASLGGAPFIRALGSRVRFSASSLDQFPRMLASYFVYGRQLGFPIPDVDRTRFFLILGGNPLVSNGSLMTAPDMKGRLRAIRRRGGKVVVVDPRRTETADVADQHFFIRPGTDALLLAAMLGTVFEEGFVELGACAGRTEGMAELEAALKGFTPESVSTATGIDADDIRRLAREFAASPSAACYGRVGTCLQSFGTLANFLIDCLNVLTGRVDRAGGLLFTRPAAGGGSRGHYGRWRSRLRGTAEFGGELPTASLAEEIETEGQGQVRAMFTMAGNPALSAPNGRRLDEALGGLDFMVSVDPAINETTRHADVILPPRSPLTNDQYSLAFNALAVRNVAKFSRPVFAAGPDELSEWEILGRLARRLDELRGGDGSQTKVFDSEPAEIIDMMLAAGPYELSVDGLLEQPSGVDLGTLEEGGLDRGAVGHDDGRLSLFNEHIFGELDRLRQELGTTQAVPEFTLIGRRQLRSNNSWMHNCPSLMKGRDRCTLLIHPADAERYGIADGARVSVSTRVGQEEATAEVDEGIMPGVVSLPHGFGHSRPGAKMSVASARPGTSINDLTDDGPIEALLGNAIMNGVPVELAPL
jgi:anaerobic selenocysteine-containing dehydrogenase